VARESEHPELAWQFAKANMKQLLAKADALGVNSYAPNLFAFFSDPARITELQAYAKSNLPPAAAKAVKNAVDEVSFRAEFKQRLAGEIASWDSVAQPRG
jgi:aminopeptidase N